MSIKNRIKLRQTPKEQMLAVQEYMKLFDNEDKVNHDRRRRSRRNQKPGNDGRG